jgi:FkbM family methyltransferase
MIKQLLKGALNKLGYELKKVKSVNFKDARNSIRIDKRPIGRMDSLLEDLKSRGFDCKSILDIGANNTNWSIMARNIFPNAHFYLVEPQTEMEYHLKKFAEETATAFYFLKAVGARNEILTFTVSEDLAGSSFLPKEEKSLLANGKQRKIEIITIDDLINSNEIIMPELIKLDIQGFELEALKGAQTTFGNTEVYIVEVSLFPSLERDDMPVISDVINFMLERDYTIYDFPGFLRRPLDGALGQCDICFVKKDSFLRSSYSWK